MKKLMFLVAFSFSSFVAAAPNDCKPSSLNDFPDFWADAQDKVGSLNKALNAAEAKATYSKASAGAFRKSLKICESKRKDIWNDPSGNGGIAGQMKCEATLICSRISVIEMAF